MRFTIRDLLWLMTVVAVLAIWLVTWQALYVDHNAAYNAVRHAQHREDELRRAIQAEGYDVNWNEDRRAYDVVKRASPVPNPPAPPQNPPSE
jgi:hypothetical protein